MSTKARTIEISNVKYATAIELDENYHFLERLVEAGKIKKASWNGSNYYEVEAVKKVSKEMRTIPPGYVRATDHAILLGSDSQTAAQLCKKSGAPARKIIVNGAKASWFVDKSWLEKQLGYTPKPALKPAITKVTPVVKPAPVTQEQANTKAIQDLQATINELRGVIQNLTRGRMTPETVAITEDVAREQGYRPLAEMAQELEVSQSTLLGWKARGQVRFYKVSGRVFLNVEDVERMYLKLDENRAIIARKMGEKTNNNLGHSRTNGVS